MKALISLKRIITLCILFVSCSTLSQAKVSLPKLISDGMVLQRNTPLLIWGSAEPGENIYIKFKKEKVRNCCRCKWKVAYKLAGNESRRSIYANQRYRFE